MRRNSPASRFREEILAEWRGMEEPCDLNSHVSRASDFVMAILRAAGAEDGLHEDQVREAWSELAGDFIARNSEPASIKGGHLILRVTQPALRFQLEQMKPLLMARLRSQLGENRIKSIKFTLG